MEMKTHKIRDTIFLFLTAMIWGAAFVAQSISMDYIGPFTFICLRSVIGGLFLIPVIMVIDNIRKKRRSESVKTASDNGINSFQKMQAEEEKLSWKNKRLLESGIVCGIFLFLALFSADGNSVHNRRKGRIYHNILYYYRTGCRPFL